MFKVNNKVTRTMPMTSFWCIYCYLLIILNIFHTLFYASIANFEQVNTGLVIYHRFRLMKFTQTRHFFALLIPSKYARHNHLHCSLMREVSFWI